MDTNELVFVTEEEPKESDEDITEKGITQKMKTVRQPDGTEVEKPQEDKQ